MKKIFLYFFVHIFFNFTKKEDFVCMFFSLIIINPSSNALNVYTNSSQLDSGFQANQSDNNIPPPLLDRVSWSCVLSF